MISRTMALKLARHLTKLAKHGDSPSRAICASVSDNFSYACRATVRRLFWSWPEFSGCTVHPVPAPKDYVGSCAGYFYVCGDYWAGEYGAARKRLALHCAAKLRAYHAGELKAGDIWSGA